VPFNHTEKSAGNFSPAVSNSTEYPQFKSAGTPPALFHQWTIRNQKAVLAVFKAFDAGRR
jgi:hypothetical protein